MPFWMRCPSRNAAGSEANDRSIDDDLIARMEHQDVIHDDLSRIKLVLSPITHDRRLRACQQCDTVQGAFSPYLLDETNHRVKRDYAHGNKSIRYCPTSTRANPTEKSMLLTVVNTFSRII